MAQTYEREHQRRRRTDRCEHAEHGGLINDHDDDLTDDDDRHTDDVRDFPLAHFLTVGYNPFIGEPEGSAPAPLCSALGQALDHLNDCRDDRRYARYDRQQLSGVPALVRGLFMFPHRFHLLCVFILTQ